MTVIVFPGQGSQITEMGKDFYDSFQEVKDTFGLLSELTKINLEDIIFNNDVFSNYSYMPFYNTYSGTYDNKINPKFGGYTHDINFYIKMNNEGNLISSSISPDTDGVIIDSEAKVLTFHGANGKDNFSPGSATRNNVRLAIGQVDSDKYGMRGFDGSGNRLFEISETRNEIAGWTIEQSKIVDSSNKLRLEPAGHYTISASNFQVSLAGEMTASAGLIGGFTTEHIWNLRN